MNLDVRYGRSHGFLFGQGHAMRGAREEMNVGIGSPSARKAEVTGDHSLTIRIVRATEGSLDLGKARVVL